MIAAIIMSMNDHGWGNKPDPGGNKGGNQGPPDLEELWRDLNRRLSALFGRKTGGGIGGGGAPRPPFNLRQFGGGVGLLAALVIVVWLAS
ncbi:MAG: protease modulator HflK N-terminal domain-containing protein, partial [Sterolibacterium sp.]